MSTRCPAREDLERLVTGLGGIDVGRLEAHLADCDRCLEELSRLRLHDPVVEALRCAVPTLPPGEASPVALTARLRSLGSVVAEMMSEPIRVACEMFASPQNADEIGRLGPYRVLKLLGVGGMGVVFQAEDTQLKRLVALKVMQPAFAAEPSAKRRFQREAEAMAAVKHDHIATIHQIGEEQGVPFLVMELLEGETLDARLRREGRLPLSEILRLGRQIAEGLAAVHAHGLVHRDIKPGNIWLEVRAEVALAPTTMDRVKVLDFGLAREANPGKILTRTGGVVGTPMYMAPEQAQGKTVDHRCDLFSLGCVLYAMATGDSPFRGDSDLSVLHALANVEPRPVREVNPDVPSALSDLIAKLLCKQAEKRPASAREVADLLALIAGSQPPKATRITRLRLLPIVLLGLLVALGSTGYFFGAAILRQVFPSVSKEPVVEEKPHAGLYKVEFKGVLDPVLAETFAPGQTVTGYYLFDSTVKARVTSNGMHAYYDALHDFRATIGSYSARGLGGSEIQIDNDPPELQPDRYGVGVTHLSNRLISPKVADRPLLFIGLGLKDNTKRLFSDARVLPTTLKFDQFDEAHIHLGFGDPEQASLVWGKLTELHFSPVRKNP